MKKVELLAPVGDFDCLKAAVQNGADAVYLGASSFSARAFASNFDLEHLKEAIDYAHVRNVKVHLTLNILLKDNEFEEAVSLAKSAYEFGIDALIIQDLGLAKYLIDNYPMLPIHASTQMTIHNLQGALEAQKLGFKRVVLSRELTLDEIKNICDNTDVEIETFVHGALCISYSGQCLFSSMIGGRSGNRGKCAQGCRLPYELLENDTKIDKGYLLSPRDLCSIDLLPTLIHAGVDCFKIEGRMKTPEYVATVTRIYRKYIDKVLNNETYTLDSKDKEDLLQVFNRGNFSHGHMESKPNNDLIFKDKSNNMGIYLGKVMNYNFQRGYITLKLEKPISIGDSISLQNEEGKYNVSELLKNEKNIKETKINDIVTIGRMKGNIKVNDKIYKMNSKELATIAKETYSGNELKKLGLIANIKIKENTPISLDVKINLDDKTIHEEDLNKLKNVSIHIDSDITPVEAIHAPITKERIIEQLSKTKNTPFNFNTINVELDDNLYIPSISNINQLRRTALEQVQDAIIKLYERKANTLAKPFDTIYSHKENGLTEAPKIDILLLNLNLSFDYSKLNNINNVYIPLKYFVDSKYKDILIALQKNSNLYIYMPSIMRNNYNTLFINNIEKILSTYDIKGFNISNIGNIELLNTYIKDFKNYNIISNYTFNVLNANTIKELEKLNIKTITLTPEASDFDISSLNSYTSLPLELIVYGNTPLMTSNYCLLGKTNKCNPKCDKKCHLLNSNKYYLKDRMGFKFRVMPDNIQTITTIFNSKTTSISYANITNSINIKSVRIDILDESIDEILNIISTVRSGSRLEGQEYTNGNINREI